MTAGSFPYPLGQPRAKAEMVGLSRSRPAGRRRRDAINGSALFLQVQLHDKVETVESLPFHMATRHERAATDGRLRYRQVELQLRARQVA